MTEDSKMKTPRSAQTRETQASLKPWAPPSQLDAPPCPNGFRQRWIRERINGVDDSKNINAKLREGWELVRADAYPDSAYSVYTGSIPTFKGVISVGDLLLARMPEVTAKQRDAYFEKKTSDQTEAWETDALRDQHPSMPMNVDRQNNVTLGGNRNKKSDN